MIIRTSILAAVACLGAVALAHGLDQSGRTDLTAEDLVRVRSVTTLATDFASPEPFEAMQAGAGTAPTRLDSNAFSLPSSNLDFEGQQQFSLGNGIFRKDWVSSPSSTQASDGLGPLFNARACQSCHIKDGRGHAPVGPDDSSTSLLVRISRPPTADQAADIAAGRLTAAADPVYGGQIQDGAVAGLKPEAHVQFDYEPVTVALSGGDTATLRRPHLTLVDPGFGEFADDLRMSARVSPPMIGLGLVEAIAAADILAAADPGDANGDGISGRANWSLDIDGQPQLGRFGWKAAQPTILEQTAHAFAGDMGLSTRLMPSHYGDCMPNQPDCLAMPNGAQPRLGNEEVPDDLLDLVVFYSQNLGVPARRNVDGAAVLAGKALFYDTGCVACHAPKYVTSRDAGHPAQAFQLIWPYSDFLLHDMGADLSDQHTEGLAEGAEWRTPPLWGIGLSQTVNAEATFLHDGRAQTLLEAVLWHGGEGQAARDAVVNMTPVQRSQLVAFMESL